MDIFALKLLLTPALIGLISLAGRRWGPTMSGLLVGIPLTSAPVAFFVAISQGASFASATAMGTLTGTISQAAFCVVYSRLAFRFGWLITVLLSSLVFIVSTLLLQPLNIPLIPLDIIVMLFLILAMRFKTKNSDSSPNQPKLLPNWDIPARMVVATTYVVLLTSIAPHIGPHLTGLMSPFPLYAAILAVFAHHLEGPAPAVRVMNGLIVGLFGFASFFVVLSGLLPQVGILVAFTAAITTVLTIQAIALWLLQRTDGQ